MAKWNKGWALIVELPLTECSGMQHWFKRWLAVLDQANSWIHTERDLWHYDDVIKWKHFPRYWPFVRGIHRWPRRSPHKGQWRGALMFSLICAWINGWVNNREAGDLRRHRAYYDVSVMQYGVADELIWTSGTRYTQKIQLVPVVITWINLNPSKDKWFHPL